MTCREGTREGKEKGESISLEGFLTQTIRRRARNEFIIGVVILIGVIAAVVIFRRYLVNFVRGAQPYTPSQVAAIQNPEEGLTYWVTTTGAAAYETGWELISRSSRSGTERVDGHYIALDMGGQLLLVYVNGKAPDPLPTTYTGTSETIPANVQSEVMESIFRDDPTLRQAFLPFMMNTRDFRGSGILGLILGGIMGAVGIVSIVRGITHSATPFAHSAMKSLQRFGIPEQVAPSVDAEMGAPHTTIGGTHITPHWVVVNTNGTLQITKLSDIVWVYLTVTQHRTNGIPTGKSYEGVVFDKHKVRIALKGNKEQIEAALMAVGKGASYAIFGYNKAIEEIWKRRPEALIAEVARRQAENKDTTSANPADAAGGAPSVSLIESLGGGERLTG